jgi:DNA-binding transcriptional ArsR family regulator
MRPDPWRVVRGVILLLATLAVSAGLAAVRVPVMERPDGGPLEMAPAHVGDRILYQWDGAAAGQATFEIDAQRNTLRGDGAKVPALQVRATQTDRTQVHWVDLTTQITVRTDTPADDGMHGRFDAVWHVLPGFLPDKPSPHLVGMAARMPGLPDTCVVRDVAASRTLLEGEEAAGITARLACGGSSANLQAWRRPGTPYAELVTVEGDHAVRAWLAGFEVGSGPEVAWGGSADAPRLAASAGPPSDGGPAPAFPLAAALRELSGFPGWQAWHNRHPHAGPVGLTLLRGEATTPGDPGLTWRILQSDGSSAYHAHVSQNGTGFDVQGAEVPAEFPPPDPVSITWAQAIAQWQAAGGTGHGWTFLHWGTAGSWSAACQIEPPPLDFPDSALVVGSSSFGTCAHHKDARYESLLALDAQGRPLHMRERAAALRPDVVVPTLAPPAAATPIGDLLGPPNATRFVVVWVSLLAAAGYLASLPGLRLFTRIATPEVLVHRRRAALHALLAAEPGLTATDLRRRTGAGWGAIQHHIAVLEAHGLVVRHRDGRHSRLFLAGQVDLARTVLRNPATKRVHEALLAGGPHGVRPLGRQVGLSPATILWHLRRLERAGLARRDPVARRWLGEATSAKRLPGRRA